MNDAEDRAPQLGRDIGVLGYLVPEFPGQTHAFFWRELTAIEGMGQPVRCYSTRRPGAAACPHPFREDAALRTHYVFPPALGPALSWLLSHPLASARAARYVLSLTETPVRQRLRLLGLVLAAGDLAADCARNDVGHVHIHSCANAAHLGALARILGGPAYSLTLHGDLPVYGSDHGAKFARAGFVSAVTRPLAEAIKSVAPDTQAPVIWMGVDTDRFRPPAHDTAREKGAPLKVATVARLNRTKGHRFFLEAMALLRNEGVDIGYTIAGDGPERDAIEAEVARLGLGDRVEFLGSVGEDEVLALLQSVDALALTSFAQGEAAPVTVMEAMACGLPVVCSVIGGTPDMIENGHDGVLVPQCDPDAIADATRRIALDVDYARRLGENARRTATEKFDFRANAKKLLDWLKRDAG